METITTITKTRKNRISVRQRTACFLEALPEFLEAAKKYQYPKKAVSNGY